MPLFAFTERVRANLRMQTVRPFGGNLSWEVVKAHPYMSEADLEIALCSYFYVRALNVAEREPAHAAHRLAKLLVRRLERDDAEAALAAKLPDALVDVTPRVSPDALAGVDVFKLTISLGVANNGMGPATVHLKKDNWRRLIATGPLLPLSVVLMVRDLSERLPLADRRRLAVALGGIATEYERRGDVHVGTREAAVADPGLVAAGVWKRG